MAFFDFSLSKAIVRLKIKTVILNILKEFHIFVVHIF